MKIRFIVFCEIALSFVFLSCCREKQYRYYPDGALYSEYTLRSGKIVGEFITYYENGQKSSVAQYINGKQHGKSFSYYTNGNLMSSEIYRFGKIKSLNIYDSDGRLVVDKGNGIGMIHFPSGEIMSISYLDGLPDGEQITWDDSKKKKTESVYNHGVLLKNIEWNQNGVMRFSSELIMSNDTAFYIHRSYYDNGQIHTENRVVNNVEVGNKRIWNEEGILISK